MTEEELKKIPFHFTAHMSFAHEHTTTYASEDGVLGYCVHVKLRSDGEPSTKNYTHYRIGTRVYKTYKKFIEALSKGVKGKK